MNIITKYNVGDNFYTLHDNKIKECYIYELKVFYFSDIKNNNGDYSLKIKYTLKCYSEDVLFQDCLEKEISNKFFKTKQELLNSL